MQNNRRKLWPVLWAMLPAIVLAGCVPSASSAGTSSEYSEVLVKMVQPSIRVWRASEFLETVGFREPTYLGITAGESGEFPTFQALSLNGEPVELWVRTFDGGGWELRLADSTTIVASANDLAYQAVVAKRAWLYKPPLGAKPTEDELIERACLQAQYDALSRFVPDTAYWNASRNETAGWP